MRWSGQLLSSESGEYTLWIVSDDDCRLYLNGKKLVENWTTHEMEASPKKVSLEKDQYSDLRIEYFEGSKDVGIHLLWIPPGTEKENGAGIDARALEQVRHADVAIFVGGLTADVEGEEMGLKADGFDRGDRPRTELPEA